MHCLPKVGLHALYMLNSVLFANPFSSEEKRLRKNWQNEEQTSLKKFYFFLSYTETNYFFQKNPSPPPEYQMVRP